MKRFFLTSLVLFAYSAMACTTFVIKSKSHLVFGRNLDWVSENGLIVVNKRNQQKRSIVFPPDVPTNWTSKYGSITFNQFGKELPFGGINEKGLVIEIMVANAQYPETDDRTAVNELQWIQYQLDNASTVAEVIANNEKIRLSAINQKLHFLIADQTGKVAVIEFKKGKMIVYQEDKLEYPVLENDSYSKSLMRYKNNQECRFTTATNYVLNFNEKTNPSVIDYSFNILNEVALDGSWSVVYDLNNLTINFVTQSNRKRKTIDLKLFDFTCNSSTLVYDLNVENKGLINPQFKALTFELNQHKMQDAMVKNQIPLPAEIKEKFYQYYTTVTCK